MNSYNDVKARLGNIESLLDDIRMQINKAEEWTDDSTENCVQKNKIEEALSKSEDKLEKANSALLDTINSLRG